MIINISEAKAQLSKLVAMVHHGEKVVIAKNNTPLVDLVPHKPDGRRRLGVLKGKISILDTHYFVWAISEPERIRQDLRVEIETPANQVFVSSISIAELMIKASIGRIRVDVDLIKAAEDSALELLDFSAKDAVLLKDLAFHHKDPFDRMLISQALARNYHILSNDRKFDLYECKLIT